MVRARPPIETAGEEKGRASSWGFFGAVQFTGPSLAWPIACCLAAEVLVIGRTRPGVDDKLWALETRVPDRRRKVPFIGAKRANRCSTEALG